MVLPYIDMNLPRVYMCSPSWTPLPPPTLSHPSGSSQCTSHEHSVSSIEPGLAIHFIYDNIHVSMPFSQIIPPSPSPTESETQMFIYAIYNSLHLLIPTSQSIPTLPYPPPLGSHKSVLYRHCTFVSLSIICTTTL